MNPGKHQRSKQRCQDLGWKVHDRAHLLFFFQRLCTSYVIAMFLLFILFCILPQVAQAQNVSVRTVA